MPRLFTAIPLPATVVEQLSRFREPLPGARWLESENYHLTLRFAGDVDNSTASEFADNLARIQLHGFELQLVGFGVFGGDDPRVLWAGVSASPALDGLQRANEIAARAAGLPPERRHFKPHVTIARFTSTRLQAVSRFLGRHAGAVSPPFHVDRFLLMSSKPRTGGGPYVIEEEYPLLGYNWDDDDDYDNG
jgi:2'-5' RNA ligase